MKKVIKTGKVALSRQLVEESNRLHREGLHPLGKKPAAIEGEEVEEAPKPRKIR